jgi:hypothetical protein
MEKALDTLQFELDGYHRSKGTFQSAGRDGMSSLRAGYRTLSMKSEFKCSTGPVSNCKFLCGHTSLQRIQLAWARGSSNKE